jgi:hypothetical protein
MFKLPRRQSSVIVKVRGSWVRWNRDPAARGLRIDRPSTDRSSGTHALRRFLSVFSMLSRRCVRRHNAVRSRAFVPVHCDGVASLLP